MIKLWMFIFAFFSMTLCAAETTVIYEGINLPGAEFNNKRLPGIHDKDYKWPTLKNFQQMKATGFNTVRVPFLWERIQPNPLGDLSESEMKQLDRVVQQTAQLQLNIVLDLHNYAHYDKQYLTNSPESIAIFSDIWNKLSLRYKSYPHVIFGLMNEPNRQSTTVWFDLAQAAINSIRANNATQLILVPGTAWTGMHSWFSLRVGGSNGDIMLAIKDPANNYAYEMHQYFDRDYSGTHAECVDSERFARIFERTSEWLRSNGKKAFLGEFGVSNNPACVEALKVTMDMLNKNKDTWIGWTYWATSDWMKTYMFNIFTEDPQDARLNLIKQSLANQ